MSQGAVSPFDSPPGEQRLSANAAQDQPPALLLSKVPRCTGFQRWSAGPPAAGDRLQSLMQSESSSPRLVIRPPLIQPPLVIYLLLCFTHLSLLTIKNKCWKGRLSDRPKSTATWRNVGGAGGGAAICDPRASPSADNEQVPYGPPASARCRPLVAILLLLFIYRHSQMRRAPCQQPPAAARRGCCMVR